MTAVSTQLAHGIKATTTTVGTGALTLVSLAGFMLPLARFSVGSLMSYSLQDGNNREWGIGTVAAGNVLNRTTITGTLVAGTYTTGGAALTLSGGTSLLECVEHEGSALDTIDNANALRLKVSDVYSDFVAFGLVTGTSASLSGVMTPGAAYVLGTRVEKLIADATLTFTYAVSSDTYNDISNAGVITHVAVANGAAAPAVTANSMRLEKVVTSGTAITSVVRLVGRSLPVAVKDPVTGTTVLEAGGVAIPTPGNLATNGFAALGVIVAGGVPGTALVDSTGATPPAIQAQWVPRTGTFLTLSTTTLNPGEIATATDQKALYVNNSTVSAVGSVYRQNLGLWTAGASPQSSVTLTAANTNYEVPLKTVISDTSSMMQASTGYIFPVNGANVIQVTGVFNFTYDSGATRTKCKVSLQQESPLNSSTWITIDSITFPANQLGATGPAFYIALSIYTPDTGRIRIVAQHDIAGGTVNTSLSGLVIKQSVI